MRFDGGINLLFHFGVVFGSSLKMSTITHEKSSAAVLPGRM
jgi:hypothetical protein